MKKVLVITYYWPPAGGSGIQRIAKFCKYLPEHGWEPVVVTVADGNYADRDPSLSRDVAGIRNVYRARSWEPHRFIQRQKRGTSIARVASDGRFHKVADWIRLNVFIPDARIGWRAPALGVARRAIAEQNPVAIFSTSPPQTVHLVAKVVAREFGLPWIADFRDPWLEHHAYNTAPRLAIVKRIHRRMEGAVLGEATHVTCVGPHMRSLLLGKPEFRESPTRCSVITNGYDRSDLEVAGIGDDEGKFCLAHFGRMYMRRFPAAVLNAAEELMRESPGFAEHFRFRIYGGADSEVRTLLRERLPPVNVEIFDYVEHERIVSLLQGPQVLLLSINRVPNNELIVTGKIFEYITSGNPVLGVGPLQGDAAAILRLTGAGTMYDYEDGSGIKKFLFEAHTAWRAGSLANGPRRFPEFERRDLAGQLAGLLDNVTK